MENEGGRKLARATKKKKLKLQPDLNLHSRVSPMQNIGQLTHRMQYCTILKHIVSLPALAKACKVRKEKSISQLNLTPFNGLERKGKERKRWKLEVASTFRQNSNVNLTNKAQGKR